MVGLFIDPQSASDETRETPDADLVRLKVKLRRLDC